MPDVSPTKWHLAHTTWFFETFVLKRFEPEFKPAHPAFEVLFNSYYNGVGEQFSRPHRGLLARPTVAEVFAYREDVDARVAALLKRSDDPEMLGVVELGLHHEQQHQELMLTDLKHVFGFNPLHPVYKPRVIDSTETASLGWWSMPAGVQQIGTSMDEGFCWDNETPEHRVFVDAFQLADRLTTNAEYLEFIEDGGYEDPNLWLSEGWSKIQESGWAAPLYWRHQDGEWLNFTLSGLREVNPAEPVCHVSYFEADAFARWAGYRLPTEAEWELVASSHRISGNFASEGHLHPIAGSGQMFGDVWEWTSSSYAPYPGYKPLPGTLGEYNGKFMANQYVLRGGSCATPAASHVRATYRNFFPTAARWQFSGIRLASS